MSNPEEFNVFLCHNSADKPAVKEIGLRLKDCGIIPWLDEWELRPGFSWQTLLEEQIPRIKSAAVFIGKEGIGPWQKEEIKAFLREFVERQCPVIPVILSYAPKVPELPLLLRGIQWVDFRENDPDPMKQLIWGITGKRDVIVVKKPDSHHDESITTQSLTVIQPQISTPLKEITGKDGAPMVLIPEGEFEMGSDDGRDDEKPITVYLDAFYMDKYEVTNALYKKFMDATGYKAPRYWDDKKFNAPNHPVVGVNWNDAVAYTKWAEKRLPTEAEWEKAARGGLVGKKYPWGDELSHDYANYSGTGGKDKWEYTSPVGSFDPNGYGLYDMAGNVWEWCDSWYDNKYYDNSPKSNPAGPSSGKYRVLRGGSWYGSVDPLRAADRNADGPPDTSDDVGFRCAGLPVTP
jgi:formylglycine-generating enzyme required for sulfatase activity